MRKLLLFAVALVGLLNSSGVAGPTARMSDDVVIVEGTILDMSPVLGQGILMMSHPCRLVKYKVDRVCKGKYKGGEIIVDHILVRGDGLKDTKVGDKVYALAWRTKKEKAGTIYTSPGIRDSAEGVKYLYRGGGGVLPAESPGCSFDERKLLSIQ
jgi:hypothetical protein